MSQLLAQLWIIVTNMQDFGHKNIVFRHTAYSFVTVILKVFFG